MFKLRKIRYLATNCCQTNGNDIAGSAASCDAQIVHNVQPPLIYMYCRRKDCCSYSNIIQSHTAGADSSLVEEDERVNEY